MLETYQIGINRIGFRCYCDSNGWPQILFYRRNRLPIHLKRRSRLVRPLLLLWDLKVAGWKRVIFHIPFE